MMNRNNKSSIVLNYLVYPSEGKVGQVKSAKRLARKSKSLSKLPASTIVLCAQLSKRAFPIDLFEFNLFRSSSGRGKVNPQNLNCFDYVEIARLD